MNGMNIIFFSTETRTSNRRTNFEHATHKDYFLVVHHVSRRRYLYRSSKHDIVEFWILIRHLLSVVNETLSSKWRIDFRGPLVPFFFIISSLVEDWRVVLEDCQCCQHTSNLFSTCLFLKNYFFLKFQRHFCVLDINQIPLVSSEATLSSKWSIDFRGPLVPFSHLQPLFNSIFFDLFQVFRWVTMKIVN